MATKRQELANPNGCLNQAVDDEPIFVLRANDELAADIVRIWARRYVVHKRPMAIKQQLKYTEALKLADEMDKWRNRNKR